MRFRSIATVAALCCSAPAVFAQSLTRVQLIGLQQQLRDDDCGVTRVTGRMDAMTKRAVQKCMPKYNVSSGGATALLAAMNIGFGPGDAVPSLAASGPVGISDSTAMQDSTQKASPRRKGRGNGGRMHRRGQTGGSMPSDSMPSDSSGMHRDSLTTSVDTFQGALLS